MWTSLQRWLAAYHNRTRKPAKPGKKRFRFRSYFEPLEDRITPAQLWTDKPDYMPGETAFLAGSGFLAGETVQLQVLHTDGTPNTGGGHAPWYVTDGGAGDLDGKRDGNFLTTWYVNPDDSAGSAFQATAYGLTSGQEAFALFTDAQEDYKHWANLGGGQWQNGALQQTNSAYTEGQVVPHHWVTSGLTPGTTYAFNIHYNWYHPIKNEGAFSRLDAYNANYAVPPVGAAPAPTGPALEGGGQIHTVGATVTSVAPPVLEVGGIIRYVTVTFAATATTAEFYWGFDLALPGEITPTSNGAAHWSGASLQTLVSEFPAVPGIPMLGGGGTLAINPNAIIPILTLNVDKAFAGVTGGNGNTLADAPGDILHYTVTVSNAGNVPLTGVSVVDPLTGQNIGGVTLGPGQSQTFASSYTLTQTDLDGRGGGDGDIDNTVTADSDQTGPKTDTEAVPLVYAPAITIDKVFLSVTGGDNDGVADAAGDVLNYTVTVTNAGNVTLTNVAVTDPLTGLNATIPALAPGQSQVLTAAYTLTQADVDGRGGGDGDVDNTASAVSAQTPAPVTDSESVPLVYAPAITIDKRFVSVTGGDNDGVADAAGDVLNYTVTVTNAGHVTLTGVTVTDPLTGLAIANVTLAPGASQTFNASYTLTQADVDGAGNAGPDRDVDNTATADSNETAPVSDTVTVPLAVVAALTIDKAFVSVTGGDDDGVADAAGDVLNYTVTVRNAGHVTLTNVAVTDPLTGLNATIPALAPGQSQVLTAAYTLTQADVDGAGNAGPDHDVDNTATADSDQTGPTTDSESVPLVYAPAITIDKAFAGVTGGNGNATADAAGDVLNYTVTVKNAGHVTLTNVTVTDPLTGQNVTIPTLAPGASQVLTAAYTLTQADVDGAGNAGPDHDVDNTATADSDQTGPTTDTVSVPLVYAPAITIDKAFVSVTGGDNDGVADAAGDVLNYTVTVTNAGNVTLTNVAVTDPLTGQNVTGVTLGPGQSQAFASSYTLTQADVDGRGGGDGDVDNTASAVSAQTPAPVTDSESVPLVYAPAITIDKAFAGVTGGNGNATADAAGDVLNYTVTVKNAGHVTLTNVTVTDPLTGQNVTIPTLAPGASQVLTAAYTLTQADVDGAGNAGPDHDVDNTATADSDQTGPTTDTVSVPLTVSTALTIDKAFVGVTGGNGNGLADQAGDVLNYTVTARNAGNVTLTNVTVTDPLTGQNATIPTLAPGQSQTFNASYTLTQADLDANGGGDGDVDNTATADSDQTGPTTDTESVPLALGPAITIDKAFTVVTGGNGNGLADQAGDVLNYTVTARNAGNVTLTNVTVTDPLTGQNATIPTLAPGQSQTFNASYTLTQADLDANGGGDGDVDNTATADSDQTGPTTDTVSVPLVYAPAITIDKRFVGVTGGDDDGVADAAGDVLNYTVTVTNAGNVTLTNVAVTDPLTGQNVTGVTLGPGQSQTFASSYTLTQADVDGAGNAGPDHDVDNTATADSDQTGPASDTESVPLVYAPALTIDKAFTVVTGGNGNGLADQAGDVLNYTVTVRNAGNVTLTNVTVTDPLTGMNVGGVTLLPGQSQAFAAAYTLTQADLDAGVNVDNTATADSDQTGPTTDSATVPLALGPAITIDKAFTVVTGGDDDGVADAAGDVLNYTVTVRNAGNVTLTGVTVTDPLTGLAIANVTLAPGASQTFAAAYTLTQADVDGAGNAGPDHDVDNTATADSDQTGPASDTESVPLVYAPALTIDKAFTVVTGGNNNGLADQAGDVLNYTVTVRNAGHVTLTNVTVTDPLTGMNVGGVTLLPGQSQAFAAAYTLTQADLDAGVNVDNTATADSDQTGPTTDSATVPLALGPAITIDKAFTVVTGGDDDGVADAAGDVLNYTVTVRNAGNVTLTNVAVTDPLTGLNATIPTLAPGQSQAFASSYTLTQADVDGRGGGDGDVDNTASAVSAQTPAPVTDSESVPLVYAPAITIDKAFAGVTGGNGNATADAAGDVLNYAVTVRNAGHVTLTNVTATDPLTGQNVTIPTLAPGASQTFNASYTLTQADLDANGGGDGDVDNTATADSDQTGPVTDAVTTPLAFAPAITIDKAFVGVTGGDGDGVADWAGDVLNYTVTVRNAGNVTLTNVAVTDPVTGQNVTGVTLAPGESRTFATAYSLTQADLDQGFEHGDIHNHATADSDQTEPVEDSVTVPLVYAPAITIDKAFAGVTGGNGNATADAAGDVLHYTVTVTNAGNVTLTGLAVTDPLTGLAVANLTLGPGQSQTFSVSYTLTRADLGTDGIANAATADSDQTGPTTDSVFQPIVAATSGPAGRLPLDVTLPPPTKRDLLASSLAVAPDPLTGRFRSAVADFNGDGVAETVIASAPGAPGLVEVIDGRTGAVLASFAPFEPEFAGGLFVTTGDLTGDGTPDLVVTPDQGGGPRVQVYNGNGFGKVLDFFGIEDPNFRGGVRPAVGDVNGDGVPELVIAAGYGGGPRITVWDGQSIRAGSPTQFANFFAFEPALRNGAYVAAGDLDGDGFADLILGGGPDGGPRVRAFSGRAVGAGFDPEAPAFSGSQMLNFFAGDPNTRSGVRVAFWDTDGDGRGELVTGSGPGETPPRLWSYQAPEVLSGAGPEDLAVLIDEFVLSAVFVG